MENLGINTNNLTIEAIEQMGFKRAEVCLGRAGSYEERLEKILFDIEQCQKREITFSIHLPVYLKEWFPYDYLAAFFLDPAPDKRQLSFDVLQENIKKLATVGADFFVLHFPGIYLEDTAIDDFDQLLTKSLERINAIAQYYNVKVLLEYFGSNRNFSDYREWVERLKKYPHLGILVDTGHLYFASLLNDFDFNKAFDHLSKHADAFHLWTTKGNKPYKANQFYRNYHHIPMNLDQTPQEGWAFDSKKIIEHLKSVDQPIIIEASDYYKGRDYFLESVQTLKDYFETFDQNMVKERSL
jgi:sugar phosphate isomerase/epimerase